jgi:ribosomal protein S18 acetylase RimI-like enzyme
MPADAPAIAALHAASWRAHYRGAVPDRVLDGDLSGERLRHWRARLEFPVPHQAVRVAMAGGRLAGFVCVYGSHDPEWGSLVDNLHVADPLHRQGVGRTLMGLAGAWLDVAHPVAAVHLLVIEANTQARRFYERIGGVLAERLVHDIHGAPVPSCRYVWPGPAALAALLPSR